MPETHEIWLKRLCLWLLEAAFFSEAESKIDL